MQGTDNQTTVQEKGLPDYVAGTNGLHYRRVVAYPEKFFGYTTKQDATHEEAGRVFFSPVQGERICVHMDVVSKYYRATGTLEHESTDTSSTDDKNKTTQQPPLMGMTDEELADSGNIDFDSEEQTKTNEHIPPPPPPESEPRRSSVLNSILETSKIVGERAKQAIIFSPPLITHQGAHIFGRSTINVIQGNEGAHKSRLAEEFLGVMLAPDNSDRNEHLGYERPKLERFAVCYGDSERNLKEEFPAAIQSIKRNAGFSREEEPNNLFFFSVKSIPRRERLLATKEYLMHVRQQTDLHLITVLDVSTDFVSSFNDEEQAMSLFDFLGNLCDEYNCTFIIIIHQNPGTEKARGHVGTEAANKAASVLQISIEQDSSGVDTGIIKIRYKKIRRGPKPAPLLLEYVKEHNRLEQASADRIAASTKNRQRVADTEDVADQIADILSQGPLQKSEVCKLLEKHFDAAERTIRGRIKLILESPPEMYNQDGDPVKLAVRTQDGKHFYELVSV